MLDVNVSQKKLGSQNSLYLILKKNLNIKKTIFLNKTYTPKQK